METTSLRRTLMTITMAVVAGLAVVACAPSGDDGSPGLDGSPGATMETTPAESSSAEPTEESSVSPSP